MEQRPVSLLYRPSSYVERLDLGRIFPTMLPLELELGAGDGSFLVQWAQQNPQHSFLGIERLLGRIRKIERKSHRAGLQNVRVMRIEAAYFLRYLLPKVSVRRLHVYFPDPWPKRKHRKNRLVNADFAGMLAQVLTGDGEAFFRTDDSDYFEQITETFAQDAQFVPFETPAELRAVVTDFEREFNARGVETLRAAYRLKPHIRPA